MMTKYRKTLVLMAVAVLLFIAGLVTGKIASSTPVSEHTSSSFGMSGPAVVLYENGRALSDGKYEPVALSLSNFDIDSNHNTMVKPGKTYEEELTAQNASNYDQYVRMIIRRYWTKDKDKDSTLSPKLIQLETGEGWKKSKKESSRETVVLYYTNILPAGAKSTPAIQNIRINNNVLDEIEAEEEPSGIGSQTVSAHEYSFDGCHMVLEVELQAVQTHSPKSTIKSVWGSDAPKVQKDGTLKVK